MSWIAWIILGLIAGAIAKFIMPGPDPGGIIVTMIIGIVGALLGGWLGGLIFNVDLSGFFNLTTWILAIVGALILLFLYRLIAGGGRGTATTRT